MNESLWWEGTRGNRAVMTAIRAEPNIEAHLPCGWGEVTTGVAQTGSLPTPPKDQFSRCLLDGRRQLIAGLSPSASTVRRRFSQADIEEKVGKQVATILLPEIERPVEHPP